MADTNKKTGFKKIQINKKTPAFRRQYLQV